jgi:mRNA-degrading endonuclease toxin of MazEF toxin-antitoxin module
VILLSKSRKVIPKQGDIWIVSEGVSKQRPVVVVGKKNPFFVASLKDTFIEDGFSYDFDWFSAGLRRKSYIRLNKIYEVDEVQFTRKIGRLTRKDVQSMVAKIRSLILV